MPKVLWISILPSNVNLRLAHASCCWIILAVTCTKFAATVCAAKSDSLYLNGICCVNYRLRVEIAEVILLGCISVCWLEHFNFVRI